jgi:hypothetical protein
MDIDMAADRAQRTLVRTKSAVNDCQIGLGAANQEVNIQFVNTAVLADQFRRMTAVIISTVARGLDQICIA